MKHGMKILSYLHMRRKQERQCSITVSVVQIILFFLSFLLIHEHAFAGAWVQEKGKGLSITTATWYVSSDFWDQDRHLNNGPHYRKLEINPLLEYGVTENITVGINAFIPDIQAAGQGTSFGVGDVELLGRYRLWKSDYSVISTQLLVKIPETYDSDKLPLLGQGQYDVEWRLLYGHGWRWGENNWYFNAEGGFRKRFGEPADEIRFDWRVGRKSIGDKWVIDFKQENIIGLRNNSGTTLNDPFRERSADYDLYKATLSVLYWVNPSVGLQAGITQDVYGRNTGRGTAPFVGLWLKF